MPKYDFAPMYLHPQPRLPMHIVVHRLHHLSAVCFVINAFLPRVLTENFFLKAFIQTSLPSAGRWSGWVIVQWIRRIVKGQRAFQTVFTKILIVYLILYPVFYKMTCFQQLFNILNCKM